ncbi:MAG: hypothetical protein AAF602_15495 [Myxococcota bacterium]
MDPRFAGCLLLALITGACTTQSVDDTLRVSLDLRISDVDVNCTPNVSDDEDAKERIGGFVQPRQSGTGESCYTAGYYRSAILNFDELAADLPGGVDELTWTSVSGDGRDVDHTNEGVTEIPRGSFYAVGAIAGTQDDIATYESGGFEEDRETDDPATRVVLDSVFSDSSEHVLVGWGGNADPDLPIDSLAADLEGAQVASGDPADLAALFNDAYTSGAEDLYVFGATVFHVRMEDLPPDPVEIEIRVDLDVDYAASAEVDLLGALREN